MTPEFTGYLRSWFRLKDIAADDDIDEAFNWFAKVTAWAWRQRFEPDDRLLSGEDVRPYLQYGVLLHLASFDPRFFDLAKRMTAQTIRRYAPEPPRPRFVMGLAAELLEAERPTKGQTNIALAKDVGCILGVAVATKMGLRPLQGDRGAAGARSGCARFAERVGELGGRGFSYGMAESAWSDKERRLLSAGFDPADVSGFFAEFGV